MAQYPQVRSSLSSKSVVSLPVVSIAQPEQAAEAIAAERQGPADAQAPFLDIGDGNVPRVVQYVRPPWTRKQWDIRRAVIDRLRLWQTSGYQVLWITLTSSPQSPQARLRKDFQALRKRVFREFGFKRLEYVCVDTVEGRGVLHMLWGWKDPDETRKASFYIPFDWLQTQWKDIHGAFHVNVKRVGIADEDARRLSRYIVAQYCGDQNGLVRFSQSRMPVSLKTMRASLLRTLRNLPERYYLASVEFADCPSDELDSKLKAFFWKGFRSAWDQLVRTRSCEAFGVRYCWWDNRLERI